MSVAEQAGDRLETILVVEDKVIIRMNVSEYLRSCGYKVIEAANGDEALKVLKSPKIRVDIVFSDVQCRGRSMASDCRNGYGHIALKFESF